MAFTGVMRTVGLRPGTTLLAHWASAEETRLTWEPASYFTRAPPLITTRTSRMTVMSVSGSPPTAMMSA